VDALNGIHLLIFVGPKSPAYGGGFGRTTVNGLNARTPTRPGGDVRRTDGADVRIPAEAKDPLHKEVWMNVGPAVVAARVGILSHAKQVNVEKAFTCSFVPIQPMRGIEPPTY
jgi:hypothetical protein